jgi:hypothetical protein
LPAHLPRPFPDPKAYALAYELVRHVAGVFHGDTEDWREVRLPDGLPAEAVYRRLPSAPDIEYGGYLTRTRIRYVPGWETGAYVPASKPCTFHSHPDADPDADLPSFKDLYTFLRNTHRRHITVGGPLLWVFDKTPDTLPVVHRLNAWEVRNMIAAIGDVGFEHYAAVALRGIGFRLPMSFRQYRRVWPARVREKLGIQLTILDRQRN